MTKKPLVFPENLHHVLVKLISPSNKYHDLSSSPKKNPTHISMSLKDVGATVGTIQSKSTVCRDLERLSLMKSSTAHQAVFFGLSMDNYTVSAFSGCSLISVIIQPTTSAPKPNQTGPIRYEQCSQVSIPDSSISHVKYFYTLRVDPAKQTQFVTF